MATGNSGRPSGSLQDQHPANSVVHRRFGTRRFAPARSFPVIVEGVLALDALDQIGRKPGFLIVVNGRASDALADQMAAYRGRQNPRADFTIDGYDDESPPR